MHTRYEGRPVASTLLYSIAILSAAVFFCQTKLRHEHVTSNLADCSSCWDAWGCSAELLGLLSLHVLALGCSMLRISSPSSFLNEAPMNSSAEPSRSFCRENTMSRKNREGLLLNKLIGVLFPICNSHLPAELN